MKNKINVNISPNPLDLQTLHCSQNDTGERKFYFTLHNNGEVIDTSGISDPIFEPFDVYKGGTEQLLPVNTDDPTTSPIIADIQYPDEEKTEQEFTYRESPTTVDGKALIEKIKGNTLVWNQLVQNGNFNVTTGWSAVYLTSSIDDNTLTLTVTTPSSNTYIQGNVLGTTNGHKYFVTADMKFDVAPGNTRQIFIGSGGYDGILVNATESNKWVTLNGIFARGADGNDLFRIYPRTQGMSIDDKVYVKNCMVIDLTAMFGSTKADEIYAMEQSQSGSGVAYFRSLFPLPYYSYEQGKLLSFNGEGIKTVGKNLRELTGTSVSPNFVHIIADDLLKGTYTFSCDYPSSFSGIYVYKGTTADTLIASKYDSKNITFTLNEPSSVLIRLYINNIVLSDISDYQLEFGSTATTYEPYTSSTTSIPTSTYFPTGMKSAGTVYDELTPSKAITRVGSVDMGTLSWNMSGSGATAFFYTDTTSLHVAPTISAVGYQNYVCSKYSIVNVSSSATDTGIGFASATQLRVRDTTYQSASDFATAMNGIMLQYELATEEVTEFTHASLICEDGESILYQDDDLLACECTEDFSKDSGFKDCKIKFSNDDGVVYSNKIQLHIERKP